MVYEANVTLKVDLLVDVLVDDEIIPLIQFVVDTINATKPNYIIGDSLVVNGDMLTFSQRYPTTASRDEIIAFVEALRMWCLGGLVKLHNCFHDIGGSCEPSTELLKFGVELGGKL